MLIMRTTQTICNIIYTESLNENGKRDGIQVSRYENGMIESISTYKNGIKNGVERDYDEAGELIYEQYYINGNKA